MKTSKKSKKTTEWDSVRKKIKPMFEKAGITTCEARYHGCMGDNYLTFAHHRKRRHLKDGELVVVALLCTNCHDKAEGAGHRIMHEIIMGIIARRRRQPFQIPQCAWDFTE
jgi:hypothetical protein